MKQHNFPEVLRLSSIASKLSNLKHFEIEKHCYFVRISLFVFRFEQHVFFLIFKAAGMPANENICDIREFI